MMSRVRGAGFRVLGSAVMVLCALCLIPKTAAAYSVLAHEAVVDSAWNDYVKPLLAQRFPRASAADLTSARAYAYGGSVIQDLGYYPFGNPFFTNLVHYVRSGDFVEALVREARTIDELAFALGALSHYEADNVGHAVAVNRAVPMMFRELRRKYGPEVTYAESPAKHVMAEFSFDVVQVAAGRYAPEAYHSFIGFQVATPVLERAFRDTYSLELADVFGSLDTAIGTYRRAVSDVLPHLTEVAWRDKQDEILKAVPRTQRSTFVFHTSRHDFEREFGTNYRRPSLLARFFTVVYRIVPKVGPLKPLQFKAPTPQAEALFATSMKETEARYRAAVNRVRSGRLDLANTDFDTGRPTAHGGYPLADRTYADLLDTLADRKFAGVSASLRRDISRFYGRPEALVAADRHERRHLDEVRGQLIALSRLR